MGLSFTPSHSANVSKNLSSILAPMCITMFLVCKVKKLPKISEEIFVKITTVCYELAVVFILGTASECTAVVKFIEISREELTY